MIAAQVSDAATLLAAADGSAGDIPIFQHFVVNGGWVTWFALIPLSFIALSLVAHYALTIRRRVLVPRALVTELEAALRLGRTEAAVKIGRSDGSMLGAIVAAGLGKLAAGGEAIRAAIDDATEAQSGKLMRRIQHLNIVGSISPMIGLFGTVVGMIRAFHRMAGMEGGMANASNAAKLSADISVAFVNTFWGLLIAVPALTIFALFRNRIEAVADECNWTAEQLINTLAEGPAASAAGQAAMRTPATAELL
ncbi:MAG: MotA/TolQ/ExbB proton channel family protein [Phycisphaerae bacterium]|nr:MotA/TolQ/ExbB proton channel family protein [Phycisphaerae bacterium]